MATNMMTRETIKAWETIERIEGRYGGWFYVIDRVALTRDSKGRLSEASYRVVSSNPEKGLTIPLFNAGSPGEALVEMVKAIHEKENT